MERILSANAPGSIIEDVPPSPAYHFVRIGNINANNKVTSLTELSYLKACSHVSYYRRSSRAKGKTEKPIPRRSPAWNIILKCSIQTKRNCWKCILKEEYLQIARRGRKDWSLTTAPWLIVTPLGFAHPNFTCSHIQTSPFSYV